MQMVKARQFFSMQMVKACQFLLMTKEQLKHYCFEQKRPDTDGVALATIFST